MKRFLIAILFVLLFATQGLGAVVYVKPYDQPIYGGDPNIPYTSGCTVIIAALNTWPTWGIGGNTISGVSDLTAALSSAGTGGILYLQSGVTFVGTALQVGGGGNMYTTHERQEIHLDGATINGAGHNSNVFTVNQAGPVIYGGTINGSQVDRYQISMTQSGTFIGTTIGPGHRAVSMTGGTLGLFENCLITENENTARTVNVGAGTVIFKKCIDKGNAADINVNTTGTFTSMNSIYLGSRGALGTIGGAELIWNSYNDVFAANMTNWQDNYVISNAAGTLNVRNATIQGNPNSWKEFQNMTDLGGNQYVSPKFVSMQYGPAYTSFGTDGPFMSIDQTATCTDLFTPLAAYAESIGKRIYLAMPYAQNMIQSERTALKYWSDRGHEICVHTPSHTNGVEARTSTIGMLQIKGPANATYTISTSAPIGDPNSSCTNWASGTSQDWRGTMTLKEGAATIATIDIRPDNLLTGTLFGLFHTIDAIAGWDASVTGGGNPGALSITLTDANAVACSAATAYVVADFQRYMQYEYVEYKALLESIIGAECVTVVWPGGASDIDMRQYCEGGTTVFSAFGLNPYLGGRAAATTTGSYTLTNTKYTSDSPAGSGCSIFNVSAPHSWSSGTPLNNLTKITQQVDTLTDWVAFQGGVLMWYGHYVEEFSSDGLTYAEGIANSIELLNALVNNPNSNFMLPREFWAIARAGTDVVGDGLRYRIDKAENPDYRLAQGSPCIDAGIAVGGVTQDFRGRPIPKNGTPDIGPYESWTKPHPRAGRMINHTTQYHLDRGREGRKKETYLP